MQAEDSAAVLPARTEWEAFTVEAASTAEAEAEVTLEAAEAVMLEAAEAAVTAER
jgi:hypothetical protein